MNEIKLMATNVRLTKEEQRKIMEKSIEINKLLVNNNKAPLKESELIHKILELSITYAKVDNEGNIYLDV